MRYAHTMGRLETELGRLFSERDSDTTPRFSARFDMPEGYRSKMVITRNGKGILTVGCFSWKETEPLRRAIKYGDNHQSRPITLEILDSVLLTMIVAKRARLFPVESYDTRMLRKE